MKISEIFYSIQGEGLSVGEPMVFIRFQGCNKQCTWCDTSYAQDIKGGKSQSLEEVVSEILKVRKPMGNLEPRGKRGIWVYITGGEPLLQPHPLRALVESLRQADYSIQVATNGTFPPPSWYRLVTSWCIDIKCPSSGWTQDPSIIFKWFSTRYIDQIKFVVRDERDLEFVKSTIEGFAILPIVLVSPVVEWAGEDKDRKGARILLEPSPGWFGRVAEFCKDNKVRMNFQIHKVIWGSKKGV